MKWRLYKRDLPLITQKSNKIDLHNQTDLAMLCCVLVCKLISNMSGGQNFPGQEKSSAG